jgi:hypothetical protein
MRLAWVRFVAILALLGLFVSARPSHAQQTNVGPAPQPSAGSGAAVRDSGWIERQFVNETPSYQGGLAGITNKKVTLSGGRSISVGELTKDVFKDQKAFEAQLRAMPAGALFGAVQIEEKAFEYNHAYVVMRQVSGVVADPKLARASSPVFARIAPVPKTVGTLKDLDAAAVQKFFAAKTKLLSNESNGHPLQKAAQQSDQALLEAISHGVGPISIRDSFMILKVASTVNAQGQVLAPPSQGGVYNLSTRAPLSGSLLRAPLPQISLPPEQRSSGFTTVRAALLNGFTEAHDWFWDRRWEFFSGHAYLAAGLSYGFGIRIPIEVTARMTPFQVNNFGSTDSAADFTVDFQARTLDGDAAHYEAAGLGPVARHNAEELLLFANFGYGYSFEALWINFGNRPYQTMGFDFSQNFTPPQGGDWKPLKEYFIPASLTRTELDLGVVSGGLELGARLDGRGQLDATGKLLFDGVPIVSHRTDTNRNGPVQPLRFTSPGQTLGLRGNLPLISSGTTKSFGFLFEQPVYSAEFSLLPGVKYRATIGYKWLSKSFSDTLWFESLRVPLPSLTLGPHAGTRSEVRYEKGTKTYKSN